MAYAFAVYLNHDGLRVHLILRLGDQNRKPLEAMVSARRRATNLPKCRLAEGLAYNLKTHVAIGAFLFTLWSWRRASDDYYRPLSWFRGRVEKAFEQSHAVSLADALKEGGG